MSFDTCTRTLYIRIVYKNMVKHIAIAATFRDHLFALIYNQE